MIISCPECETSFSLPDLKVTDKGSKVRCSKCKHVFRVRRGSNGEPEVYYKNEGVADPPTQELGEIFDDEFGESLEAALAAEVREEQSDFDKEARSTMLGFPAKNPSATAKKPSKSASSDFVPFPLAGLNKKPAADEGIDLFDGQEPAAPAYEADPFGDAFEGNDVDVPAAGPAPAAAPAPAPAAAPAPAEPVVQGNATPEPEEPLADIFLGKSTSEFGPADELVDPTFGQDTPQFDAETGRVANANPPAAAPPTARRPAPAPKRAPAPAAAPKPVAQTTDAAVEDWDVAPHKMGGGGFQKFVNFVFILTIVLLGCLGYIAFRSDGMLDFKQPEGLLNILMHKAEFEPRDTWKKEPPPPPLAKTEDFAANHVFAQMVPVGEGAVLVVRGDVENKSASSADAAKVRVMILDRNEKILRESTVSVGRIAPIETIAALESPGALGGLSMADPVSISPNGTAPFMAVFADVPSSVSQNKDVFYRVEIAGN